MHVGVDARPLSKQLSGIGIYTLNVVKELSAAGVELTLFSPSPLPEEITALRGVRSVCSKVSNPIARQVWAEIALPLLLRQHQLDAFWGPAHRLPADFAGNLPRILTIHDLVWKQYPETMRKSTLWLERLFMPRSIGRANLIIVESTSTADDLQKFCKVDGSKIREIPLASRTFPNAETQEPSEISQKDYFLFVGTREPRKNLDALVKAYGMLSEPIRSKHHLLIVGDDGWGNIRLPKLISKSGLTDCVTVKAYASDAELLNYYRSALCLVMPSLYEGYGLPILEAQSLGTPVITSNIASMPQVAGKGGVLVDPYSVSEIHSALEAMASEAGLRRRLSRRARENAAQYSWTKTAQMTAGVFEEAILMQAAH
jgi:glycosyltransferase involved in cell wall biosynthesis